MNLNNTQLELIASYLRWTEVGFDSALLILSIYILYIIFSTRVVNNIELQFTKIALVLDILYSSAGIVYYSIYFHYPNSILFCQISGTIRSSLYSMCIGLVLILALVRFMKYILKIQVKDSVWYIIFASFILVDLTICLYFSIFKKMKPTLLGYCFIDALSDQSSRLGYLFVLVINGIVSAIIVVYYGMLCRLGLQIGSYINSENLPIYENPIIEKSAIVVIIKSLSIASTYLLTVVPKIISISAQVIYQKSINSLFDLVADFLFALNTITNLLTIILLNRKQEKDFK